MEALGVGPGDRVALWSENRLDVLLLELAVARLGAIIACLRDAMKLLPGTLALPLSRIVCFELAGNDLRCEGSAGLRPEERES